MQIHYTNFKPYKADVLKDKRSKKLVFESDGRYHYVYRITNKKTGEHYYGCRTSEIHPLKDLGVKYFSSSLDKEFKADVISNPQNYKFKVIRTFNNPSDKILFEAFVHQYFDVKKSPKFLNRSNQTPFGFDTTGMAHSEETKRKQSEAQQGEKNHMYGRKQTEAHRKKNSEATRGEKNPMYGEHHTEESRKRMSEAKKGVTNGASNTNAKTIHIYDNEDNLRFVCKGNFNETCNKNGLPLGIFRTSYQNEGSPIYMSTSKHSIARITNNGNIKYKGWYAKING